MVFHLHSQDLRRDPSFMHQWGSGVFWAYIFILGHRKAPGKALTVLCISPQHHQEDQLFGTRVPRRPKGKLRGLQRQPEPHGVHQQLFEWQKEQRKVRGPEPAASLSSPEMSRDPDHAPAPGPRTCFHQLMEWGAGPNSRRQRCVSRTP